MNKPKKQKYKRASCWIVLPLTIEECLLRLEAMADRELTFNCLLRTDHQAEVLLTERRNDDMPLSVTVLLRTRSNGTCVTLTRPPSTEQKADFFDFRLDKRHAGPHVVWVVVPLFVFAGILSHDPRYFLSILFPILLVYGLAWLTVDEAAYQANQINHKKGRTLNERYEGLKQEIRNTLKVKPDNVPYDKYGNMYFVERPKSKSGDES